MRPRLAPLLLAPLLALPRPPPLAALERFVAPYGSDSGDCSAPASPCETIQYAIDQAGNNDRIKIHPSPGFYQENLMIRKPVTGLVLEGGWWGAGTWWGRGFTRKWNNPRHTGIDGGGTAPVLVLDPDSGPVEVRVENLILHSGDGHYGGCVLVNTLLSTATLTLVDSVVSQCSAYTGGGVAARSAGEGATSLVRMRGTELENCQATRGGGAAAIADLSGVARIELEASRITGNRASSGAGFYAVSHREARAELTAENSFITDNSGPEGVYLEARACVDCSARSWTDAVLVNSTLAGEAAIGISALGRDGGESSVDVTNTILWHEQVDLDLRGDTVATAEYSLVRAVDVTGGATYTPGPGNVAVDPRFDEWWPQEYHLSRTSPVIDAGLCGAWVGGFYWRIAPWDDFDGDLRPLFGAVSGCDLGADEFVPFDRFVTSGGSDAGNDCSDPALPCRTIQRALDEAMADDGGYRNRVLVARGLYAETPSASGPPESLAVIGGWSDDFGTQNRDSALTVIDAAGAGAAFRLDLERKNFRVSLENLTLRNGAGSGGGGLSLYCSQGHGNLWLLRTAILDNQALWGAGVEAHVDDCQLKANLFSTLVAGNRASAGGGGIRSWASGDGLLDLQVVHSTITDNEAAFGAGIFQENYSTADGLGHITGSIVWGNHGDDLSLYDFGAGCRIRADNADVGSLFNFGCGFYPDATVVSIDPRFANPAQGDFHLAPLSPVMDQSVCRAWVGDFEDFEGDPRPLGAGCDMGADEYAAPACFPFGAWHDGDGIDPVPTPAQSPGCLISRFAPGESIQLAAQADPGWKIDGWSGTVNDASTAPTNSMIMPAAPAAAGVHYGLYDDLVLSGESFTGPQTRMACRSIRVGPAVTLQDGADLELMAPGWVEFVDDVAMQNGAALGIELSTPAPCG